MKTKIRFFLLILLLSLSACKKNNGNSIDGKPDVPKGIGHELVVDIPTVTFPLPAIKNAENNGIENLRYSENNPIVNLLFGFDNIWSLNDSSWQNGKANSKGPDSFENAEIRNSKIWKENIQYVVKVTTNRTDEQALQAYYDDRRDKCYSVIDGFGPLADDYKKGSGAFTAIDFKNDKSFDVNKVIDNSPSDDEMCGLGDPSSELKDVANIVRLLRQGSPASTNGSKIFYSSPRPWRMNDEGDVIPIDEDGDGKTDLEKIGEIEIEKYETSVKVIPALKVCRRKASDGRRVDGGYPSGHTNASYMAAIGWAYAVPERFSEFFTRASELGENRVRAGMHSPLDVIGARIQATAIAAYAFSKDENKAAIKAAYENAESYFGKLANQKGLTLYEYAHTNDKSAWNNNEANKKIFRERMTYGFSKTGKSGISPIIPEGAETLLETRQPYLTAAQRRAVLYTTVLESGYPVIDESNGWGRLDYVKAADGYAAFVGDVTVFMDSSKGRFNAHDWWRNDISGEGLLTKDGTGTLTLAGNNSYSGGTLVKNGILEAETTTAFGSGDLYIQEGTVLIDATGSLNLNGNFTIDDGTLNIVMDNDEEQIVTSGLVYIDGANLDLDFSNYNIDISTDLTLITADKITGKFNNVSSGKYTVTIKYNNDRVVAHIEVDSSKD